MDDDPRSARKPEGKKKPGDKSNTLLFKFARNLGRTARALKVGSTWLLGESGSATPKSANKVGKSVRNLESKSKALAPKEEAPDVAEEEIATTGVTVDVEAAMKAAEESAAEEVSANVEAAVKAAEETTKK